jgi:hypothetical protein
MLEETNAANFEHVVRISSERAAAEEEQVCRLLMVAEL